MKSVVVTGSFDDLRSRDVRFLEEASKLGDVHVLLWSDEAAQALEGCVPKFSQEERAYLLQAIRYVEQVVRVTGRVEHDVLPQADGVQPGLWVVDEVNDNARKRTYCEIREREYCVLREEDLEGFAARPPDLSGERKRVIVTGCFDWFHSGHVRFFEEVSELGVLYVVVGHDENVRLLKGEGHPMFSQDERRYMVQAVRYVKEALISTGHGWMDAAPEIDRIKPDAYVVNEDGDKPEKRAFCEQHGLEYVVLRRIPREGLPRRESRVLRGF